MFMCETTCHAVAHLRFTPSGIMTRREVVILVQTLLPLLPLPPRHRRRLPPPPLLPTPQPEKDQWNVEILSFP